jgi:hypothetical protein
MEDTVIKRNDQGRYDAKVELEGGFCIPVDALVSFRKYARKVTAFLAPRQNQETFTRDELKEAGIL